MRVLPTGTPPTSPSAPCNTPQPGVSGISSESIVRSLSAETGAQRESRHSKGDIGRPLPCSQRVMADGSIPSSSAAPVTVSFFRSRVHRNHSEKRARGASNDGFPMPPLLHSRNDIARVCAHDHRPPGTPGCRRADRGVETGREAPLALAEHGVSNRAATRRSQLSPVPRFGARDCARFEGFSPAAGGD